MQNWVARLTLVAYVIGGWVIPCLHDHSGHGHSGHGTHFACGSAHQASATEPSVVTPAIASADSKTQTVCKHCCSHSLGNEIADDADEGPSSLAELVDGEFHTTSCSLCAICVARSLTSLTVVADQPQLVASLAELVTISNSRVCDCDAIGIALSRGPPAGV